MADREELIPRDAAKLLKDQSNEIFFSRVSVWESSIKFALGRPDFTIEPRSLRKGLLNLGFTELPIENEHVIRVSTLPHLHRDPFDRLLVAQAQVEGLTLMTTDKTLAKYGSFVRRY